MAVRLNGQDVRWLGHVAWYSLTGEAGGANDVSSITLEQLTSWAQELDVPLVTLPAPRSHHAFRTATSHLAQVWESAPGVSNELSVVHVRTSSDVLVRHVMLTTRDSRQQKVDTAKVAEVKFHHRSRTSTQRRPGSETLTYRLAPTLEGPLRARVSALIEQMQEAYHQRAQFLMLGTLRKTVRDIIDVRLEGLQLKAGTYFIPPEHAELLERVAVLISRLTPGACMRYLPLLDEPRQRVMIAEAVTAECQHVAQVVAEAVASVRASGEPYGHRARLVEQVQRTWKMSEYYAALLGMERVGTQLALGQAREQLAELGGR